MLGLVCIRKNILSNGKYWDLFDFWFEYKHVVPKGFVRVLGKLAEIADRGIPIYFFVGNHDLWMKDYLEEQINAIVFRDKQDFIINGKDFFIVHGDGKGPGDKGYKRMKKVFTNKVCQFLFYLLHPDLAMWLGITISRKNKMISGDEDVNFLGVENEWLIYSSSLFTICSNIWAWLLADDASSRALLVTCMRLASCKASKPLHAARALSPIINISSSTTLCGRLDPESLEVLLKAWNLLMPSSAQSA